MTICIIPARGGSKRIKNKNIKKINNIPLLGHVIKTAIKSKLFSEVVVSTDSKKIKKIAIDYGAKVPFLRNKKLSNDYATTREVLVDCIKKIGSTNYEFHFCLYPTAILINQKDLIKAYKKIKKYKYDHLVAVSKFNSSPLRALKIISKNKNKIKFKYLKYKSFRTQRLPDEFFDSGSFYIWRTKKLLKKNLPWPSKTTYYELNSHNTVDINTPEDLKLAKILFNNN